MAENKTKPTDINPRDYVAAIDNPAARADSEILLEMMARITGESAKMWGPSIVGFGSYHYKYESGREGDFFVAGFASRKSGLVVYLLGQFSEQTKLLEKLGKHKMGKSCLYIKRLANIDMDVLEDLITKSVAAIRATYPGAA